MLRAIFRLLYKKLHCLTTTEFFSQTIETINKLIRYLSPAVQRKDLACRRRAMQRSCTVDSSTMQRSCLSPTCNAEIFGRKCKEQCGLSIKLPLFAAIL